MKAFKIPLDGNIMKSTQHAHGVWEGKKSRGKCHVLRKVMENAGTKTQNAKQIFWLWFLFFFFFPKKRLLSPHRDPSIMLQ